jgi:peptidoglycan hydrolase-like protein with peptidoglycan-binding domain
MAAAPPPADQAKAAAGLLKLFTGAGASQADAQAAADHYVAAAEKMITSGDYALPAGGASTAAAWNPAAHPRAPAGGPAGGQFAPGGTGAAPTNAKPVGEGAKGPQVRQLQARLKALGYNIAVDGIFGPQTLAAVRQFQASHLDANGKQLKEDGLVGPLTTSALRQKTPAKSGAKGRTSKTGGTTKTRTTPKPGTARTTTGKKTTGKKSPTTARAITRGKAQIAKTAKTKTTSPATTGVAANDVPGSVTKPQQAAVTNELTLRKIPPAQAQAFKADLTRLSRNDATALLAYIRNTYTFASAPSGDVSALSGFDENETRDTHGRWTTAEGGPGSPAARLHGKQVRGHTPEGNDVRGRYDHNTKEVLDRFGGRHKVTRVREEDPVSAAGGQSNRGNAETLHRYWGTGEGAAKIRWGTDGDHMRCVRQLMEHGHFTEEQAHGYCNLMEKRVTGEYPAQHAHREKAAAGDTPAGLPALVTIPGVDILAAGTWALSTGRQTFTAADLQSAIDASECPAVGQPVIKIGHLDPRFAPQPEHDGEPAIGRVMNLRLSGNGAKIVGDLAGMPGWLAGIAASAFPRRSVEGKYRFRCQIGHQHPFVLTGLALLGVTPPGVGVLSGLPDVATLYGLTAAAAQAGQAWRTEQDQEGTVMAVTEEDVRRQYYATAGAPQSWWITELQMFPPQLIVADEQSGKIYRVGYRIDGSAVAFDQAQEVASYADVAAARGTGPVVAYASAADSRAVILAAWDGAAAVRQLGDNPSSGTLRAMFAIPGTTKSDSSLPHHDVSGGKVGAANPDACSAAIAALNGGRGGMKGVSASQAKAAYSHLASHLRTAGRTPPDFSGAQDGDGDGVDWQTEPAEQIGWQFAYIAATYGGQDPPGAEPDGGQEPGTELEPGSLAARWQRLLEIRAAATDTDADDTVQGLVASLDATLDQAAALAGQVDPKAVPEAAGQVLALVVAAEALVDQLMDKLGIYDPDDTDSDTSAAAEPDEDGGEGVAAAGDTVHEPIHGNFDGSHSHPHRAYGTQGSDETHEHKHTHSGDGRHDHAHAETQAAADAAATQEEGNPGMGYEFTTAQMAAIRARLGKQEGEEVAAGDIAAVFGAPQPPWPVQAAAAGTSGDGPVEVPVIADGVHLVEANILRKYQEEALAGQRAVRAMHVAQRDGILAAAIKDGKFAQSRLEHFQTLWDRDPDGTRKLVASLAGGLVPMAAVGSNGDWASDPDMPGDFDAQRAYRDLYPEDTQGGVSPAPGVRGGAYSG